MTDHHIPSTKEIITRANLPNKSGVYYFYRDQTLLYVGKSVDIRQRVLSHHYAAKNEPREAKLMQTLNRITYRVTPGELSALLLESREVKEKFPLYNRKLRRQKTLLSWQWHDDSLETFNLGPHLWPPTEGMQHFGVYRNRKHATQALKSLCKEHKLCEQRLGLMANTKRPCFGAQIGHCLGVCAGREAPEQHDQRFYEAIALEQFDEWPFSGPIALQEKADSDWLVIDRWNYLGTYPTLERAMALSETTSPKKLLSLDDYRIILSFLRQQKYADCCEL